MEKNNVVHEITKTMNIDLVYMWVDGNDPEWQKKQAQYRNEAVNPSEETVGQCRYIQFDELRYAIRSAIQNAPWINNIYIITDNQCPWWLNKDNPKIKIIDHKDIIDTKYLPLFNSSAIELNICNIPGLSEHFLLGNDDTFFGRPVKPSFFFNANGTPIIRLKNKRIKKGFSPYQDMLYNMVDEIKQKYGSCTRLAPHHNIDAYCKSDWKKCLEEYSGWFKETMTHRFRHYQDMHRHLISLWMIKHKRASVRIVSRWNRIYGIWGHIKAVWKKKYASDSRYISIIVKDFDQYMLRHNPTLFNINDTPKGTREDRLRAMKFLKKRFPIPTPFEVLNRN